MLANILLSYNIRTPSTSIPITYCIPGGKGNDRTHAVSTNDTAAVQKTIGGHIELKSVAAVVEEVKRRAGPPQRGEKRTKQIIRYFPKSIIFN